MKYVPKFFKPWELVPESVYSKLGANALMVMDDRILESLDVIRAGLGKPITVNTWHEGGQLGQRGFRDGGAVGATYSQHRFGRAVDFDVQGMTADEVRSWILKNAAVLPFITRMERDVSWVHIDCAPVDRSGGIVLFAQ